MAAAVADVPRTEEVDQMAEAMAAAVVADRLTVAPRMVVAVTVVLPLEELHHPPDTRDSIRVEGEEGVQCCAARRLND